MATNQVETATVVGTITGDGNASVIVTAARMTNSPKTFSVAVVSGDTAADVALKIQYALALNLDVSALFAVSGSGANVVLTTHTPAPNDTTLNIAIDNGTCTGLTAAPTSTNTTAGDGISNGYATLADYKSWIATRGLAGSVGTDASEDAVIDALIEAASRYFDRETGKHFYKDSADAVRYFTARDAGHVEIDDLSAAPTTVSVDYNNTRIYTDLAATDYDLLPDNAALDGLPYTALALSPLSTQWFPTYRRAIRVTAKFGWPSVPLDVKDAVLAMVQSLSGTRSGQTSAGKITITAAGIVIRPEDVPAFAQKVIQHYRKMT